MTLLNFKLQKVPTPFVVNVILLWIQEKVDFDAVIQLCRATFSCLYSQGLTCKAACATQYAYFWYRQNYFFSTCHSVTVFLLFSSFEWVKYMLQMKRITFLKLLRQLNWVVGNKSDELAKPMRFNKWMQWVLLGFFFM